MKYYSEILNKMFDTEEALVDAENEAIDKELKAQKEKEERKAKKDAAHAEVVAAMEEMKTAEKKYFNLLSAYNKEFGTFTHKKTIEKDGDSTDFNDLINLIFGRKF